MSIQGNPTLFMTPIKNCGTTTHPWCSTYNVLPPEAYKRFSYAFNYHFEVCLKLLVVLESFYTVLAYLVLAFAYLSQHLDKQGWNVYSLGSLGPSSSCSSSVLRVLEDAKRPAALNELFKWLGSG